MDFWGFFFTSFLASLDFAITHLFLVQLILKLHNSGVLPQMSSRTLYLLNLFKNYPIVQRSCFHVQISMPIEANLIPSDNPAALLLIQREPKAWVYEA